jgi:pyrroline-5-carboxylate reductase
MSSKIGFIGAGNMCQALIGGWLEQGTFNPDQIYVTNRSPGKVKRLEESFKVHGVATNEELVDKVDFVVLAVKPQDLNAAIEPIASAFTPSHTVISLAAGFRIQSLKRLLPESKIVRVMPNTPVKIHKGLIGFCTSKPDPALDRWVEHAFSPLGLVVKLEEGEPFQALTVAGGAGVGFVFELMIYWQEWLEERGIDPELAKRITVQTFVGASQLAERSEDVSLVELQHKVASKKGVTASGLDSMRELEVERALRYSFEKAGLKDRELEDQQR